MRHKSTEKTAELAAAAETIEDAAVEARAILEHYGQNSRRREAVVARGLLKAIEKKE